MSGRSSSSSTTSTGPSRPSSSSSSTSRTRGRGRSSVVCLAREELARGAAGVPRRTRERRHGSCSTRCPRRRPTRCSRVSAGRRSSPTSAPASSRPPRATRSSSSSSSRSRSKAGLAERALPETIQALLAARLDRLGPGERAVLERGAVVGKEFTADGCRRAARPDAAPTAESHLQTLAGRGFVRPRGDGRVRLPARPRAGGGLPRGAEAAARGAARALRRPARHRVAGSPRARRVRRLPPRAGVPAADRARRVGSA